ncbi:hypothetical protein L1987_31201 [Smallanthus sonchifolius]|uniref:Uncharacterized protein n=1 Tax=Smallanthus sonchifolius TaxID=185202 RepID=A0ACB9I5V6_9ASTR|nr:hypothetical protein L1987_31201 [Smallanthus sonchifolius]
MIDFHGDAITAEVFVTGTPGFDRSALEIQTNRQNPKKNDEAVDNDNLTTKKDEKVDKGKEVPKKDRKVKKEDKVAKSPVATPARRTRQSVAAAAKIEASSHKKDKKTPKQKQKQKQKTISNDDNKSEGSTDDSSSSSESEQVNVNVDSDCGSDYVPSRYAKRKKVNSQNETEVNASPADGVKKRRRTPTWKVGANGRPTIVSDHMGSKSKGGSGNRKSQRKSGKLATKGDDSKETKSGRKRGRPRAITSDQEHDDFVGPSDDDDDVSPETLVSLWKSAITDEGEKMEIENARGENEQALKIEDKNEGGGETETRTDKEDCEKVEVEDEKGEKMETEIEITGGENEQEGKVEDEKEVEKDEGVLVLPPIPAQPVDVMKEKMDWDETEAEQAC